jgi:hypothetical protein
MFEYIYANLEYFTNDAYICISLKTKNIDIGGVGVEIFIAF